MTSTKILIEENNRKRDLLTEENEKYYSDLLLYIRLQFRLSERQSEEILMELLDHLLDGQNEGKTAREIFGDDPKGFADEIICQLPSEALGETVPFFTQIILNILGWALMIRGVILVVSQAFTDVNESFFLFSFIIIAAVISANIVFVIWVIFRMIRSSLFKINDNERGNWKDSLKVGLAAAFGMGIVILTARFIPDLGPAIFFPWYASLVLGGILWGVSRFMKKYS